MSNFYINIFTMPQSLSANLSYKERSNIAYDNSFVLIENDTRQLYAQAAYIANASDLSFSLEADSINLNVNTLEKIGDKTNTLLNSITARSVNSYGFQIPQYDEIDMTYFGSTNNIKNIVYKNNSKPIFTLAFKYTIDPPLEDDALLSNIKRIYD